MRNDNMGEESDRIKNRLQNDKYILKKDLDRKLSPDGDVGARKRK